MYPQQLTAERVESAEMPTTSLFPHSPAPMRLGLWPPRRPAPPERSFALRRLVFLASLPPILAAAWIGALWGPALLTIVVLGGAHYYSWRAAQNEKANSAIRLVVFVALHLAAVYMCAGFYAGFRLPQAQFALYAQAITAFDLRRRMNLFSSLGMSLIVLYVGATLARDYVFIIFVLAFLALALAVFYRAEIEDGLRGAKIKAQGPNLSLPTSHFQPLAFGIWLLSFVILSFPFSFIFPFCFRYCVERGFLRDKFGKATYVFGWSCLHTHKTVSVIRGQDCLFVSEAIAATFC